MKQWLKLPAVVVLLLALPVLACAQNARPPEAGDDDLQFRWIFAPKDRIDEWPLGSTRYVPVEADEFERLIKAVHARDTGALGSGGAYLASTQFDGKLQGDDLLSGKARVEVVSRAKSAVLLPLDPCSLAIADLAWKDKAAPAVSSGVGADRKFSILADRSGELGFEWSLRGQRNAAGVMTFQAQAPASPSSRFTLDVPAPLRVACDVGLVTELLGAGRNLRRWRIDAGGHHKLQFRIGTEEALQANRELSLYKQTLAYEFSPRGIDVSAQLKLDVYSEPIERLTIELDAPLRLVAARQGDKDVPWTLLPGETKDASQVLLELPEPMSGLSRALKLSALGPVQLGKTWRLPGIRLDGLSWQESTATLLVPAPLKLEKLDLQGCRQAKAAALPAPLSGDSVELQYHQPRPGINVLLARPAGLLKAETGELVDLGAAETVARTLVELSVTEGERFDLQAEIAANWLVDSVEAKGFSGGLDWSVRSADGKPSQLVVQLSKSLSPKRPLRLLVGGHRVSAVGEMLGPEQLKMLQFKDAAPGKYLLAVRAVENYDLETHGAETLTRISPQHLTAGELQLFPGAPSGMVFLADANAAKLTVAIIDRKPSYRAEIQADVLVEDKTLSETLLLRCLPEAARVDRLLVHVSSSSPTPWRWSLAGGAAGLVTARKLVADENPAVAGETWELSLHLPKTGPFEVRAVRTVPLDGQQPVALASLPEASAQRGLLTVRVKGNAPLEILNRRLSPVPAELLEADRIQTTRAAFRYDPARDAVAGEAALSLALAKQPPMASGGALAWSGRLESRFVREGAAAHRSTWCIETAGRPRIEITMPADSQLRSTWLDGAPVAPVTAGKDLLQVDLPAGRRFVALSLHFNTSNSLPRFVTALDAPIPQIDVPLLRQDWSLWLPPGYKLTSSDAQTSAPQAQASLWTQRLFGPLARGSAQGTFDPFAAKAWRNLNGPGSEVAAADATSRAFLTALSAALSSFHEKDAQPLNWGRAIAAAESRSPSGIRVLIDVNALQRANLAPESSVEVVRATKDSERAQAALTAAGLMIVALDNRVLVTTNQAAIAYQQQLLPLAQAVAYAATPGTLADDLQNYEQDASQIVPVEAWRVSQARAQLAWHTEEPAGEGLVESRGWTVYSLSGGAEAQSRVQIVRTASLQVVQWAVFLLVVAVGIWKDFARLGVWLLGVGGLAAAALLLPAPLVPLIAPGFLGALCVLFFLCARAWRRQMSLRRATSTLFTVEPAAVTAGLLALASVLCIDAANAAEPNPAEENTGAAGSKADAPPSGAGQDPVLRDRGQNARWPIHRIFVPVDKDFRPDGGKYYVPGDLFVELGRRSAAATEQPTGWLIEQAAYQGALSHDAAQRKTTPEIKAAFGLHVFQPNVQVRLPLARDGVSIPPGAAKLDGRSINVSWEASGDALSFTVPEPGDYQFELALQPLVQRFSFLEGFDIALPPIATAALTLKFPPVFSLVECPSARGKTTFNKQGDFRAHLGPTPKLSVRWSIAGSPAAANVDVDELLWFRVQPGGTLIDARFKFRVVEGVAQRFRLLVDPAWQLLVAPARQNPLLAGVQSLAGNPEMIEVELTQPVSDAVTIDLTFLRRGGVAAGAWKLPRLESAETRLNKRWLAVSADQALQFDLQPGLDLKPIIPGDFLAAWGGGESRPTVAYSAQRGETAASVTTRPRETRATVDETLIFGLGQQSTSLELAADVTVAAGYLFQLHVAAPRDFTVEHVSVLDGETQRVAHWSQDAGGALTILLTAPLTARGQLRVRGVAPAVKSGDVTVPKLQTQALDCKRRQLQIYRRPDVLVDAQPATGLEQSDFPLVEPTDPNLGSLVGTYLRTSDDVSGIKVSPNVPAVEATLVIAVEREDEFWVAEMDYQLRVERGLVDALRFDVPSYWVQPFQLDRSLNFEVLNMPGENRRQLIVRPGAPVKDQFRVRIRGRIAPTAAERLRVPDIVPQHIGRLRQYVVLPNQLELQQIAWQTVRLEPAGLPDGFRQRAIAPEAFSSYHVVGDRFQASLKAVERSAGKPLIALAETQIAWQADGSLSGVTTFDVEPAGLARCVLRMPADSRLLHATVSDLPAALTPLGADRWQLTLASRHLPQRIQVVYSGVSPGGESGKRRFEAPQLADFDVAQTLWSVAAPFGFGRGEATPRAVIDATEYELTRLESMQTILSSGGEKVGDELAEESHRWFRPWLARQAVSRSRLRSDLARVPDTADREELENRVKSLDKRQATLASRFAGMPTASMAGLTADARGELLSGLGLSDTPTLMRFEESQNALTLHYARPVQADLWIRLGWTMAMSVSLLGTSFFLLRSRPWFPSPHAVAIAAGLFWWLFLWPSAVGLGWAVLAGGDLAYIHFSRVRRRTRHRWQ